MNKKITAMSLAAVITAASLFTAALADDTIKILVNDNQISFEELDPFIENERTLVPMREIFEALGAQVAWDGETKTVVSYDPVSDVSITMQVDSNVMFVGEKSVELDVPAKIVGSSTVVPVRAIAEGMSSVVKWNNDTRTVTVEKKLESE